MPASEADPVRLVKEDIERELNRVVKGMTVREVSRVRGQLVGYITRRLQSIGVPVEDHRIAVTVDPVNRRLNVNVRPKRTLFDEDEVRELASQEWEHLPLRDYQRDAVRDYVRYMEQGVVVHKGQSVGATEMAMASLDLPLHRVDGEPDRPNKPIGGTIQSVKIGDRVYPTAEGLRVMAGTATPMRDKDGKIIGTIADTREEALKHVGDYFGQWSDALKVAIARNPNGSKDLEHYLATAGRIEELPVSISNRLERIEDTLRWILEAVEDNDEDPHFEWSQVARRCDITHESHDEALAHAQEFALPSFGPVEILLIKPGDAYDDVVERLTYVFNVSGKLVR